MSQDRESGARAREFGYDMAHLVAQFLGASLIRPGRSNEAILGNTRILIKSAHWRVSEIGATRATLDRIDRIISALEDSNDSFTLYEVLREWYLREMRQSGSSGKAHLMMVRCRSVRVSGLVIGHILPN